MDSTDVLKVGVGVLIGLIFAMIASWLTGVELQLLISGIVMALIVAGVVLFLLGESSNDRFISTSSVQWIHVSNSLKKRISTELRI